MFNLKELLNTRDIKIFFRIINIPFDAFFDILKLAVTLLVFFCIFCIVETGKTKLFCTFTKHAKDARH